MRFIAYENQDGTRGLGLLQQGKSCRGRIESDPKYPGSLQTLIARGGDALNDAGRALKDAPEINLDVVKFLPPVASPGSVICVGLNYADHSKESGYDLPSYPTIFGRFNSSLIGHRAPIVRPSVSTQLDYEGELVAVIGKKARHVSIEKALDYVVGYSIFNDASVRDYQVKTPQWTIGKNFDDTGAFGPSFVTADELPPGCAGLRLQTRLNGQVVQDASTSDMVFSVAKLVSILSEVMTLGPGDIIVTGTPSGIGLARKPQLFMKAGDVCEVEIEGLGILTNPIVDEAR